MSYIPRGQTQQTCKIKRSEFIAFLLPISTNQDVSREQKSLRRIHHAATHICWAYRIQDDRAISENCSDAGEPPGTAGLPLLNVLRSHQVVNAALIVVRYFGGIKLGRRGLTNAYRQTAAMVLESAHLIEWIPQTIIHLEGALEFYGQLFQVIKQFNGQVINDISGEKLQLDAKLPLDCIGIFSNKLRNMTQGKVVFS